jgi:hypothetical protein
MGSKTKQSGRTYEVDGKRTTSFEEAAGRAVTLAVAGHESVCIKIIVRGTVVERIDVTAAFSIDPEE